MLGIALATSLIFVSWALVDTVQLLLERQFVQIQRADATVVLAASRPASDVATYVNVDGVAAIEPQLSVPVTLDGGSRRYATALIGLVPGTTMRSLAGSDGHAIPLDPGGVILGTALRDTLAVGVGDTVSVALETGVINGVGIGGNGTRVADLRVIGFDNEPLGSVAYASLSTV